MSVEMFEPFYLYGITKKQIKYWELIQYIDILDEKIYLAKIKIKELARGKLTDETMLNIKACQRAIAHNEKLLKEIK